MNVLIVTMLNVSPKCTTYLHQSVTHKYVRINNKMKMNFFNKNDIAFYGIILYTNIHQIFVNSLHRLLNCEIGGLDCHVITTENTCPLYTHVTPIL